MKSFDMLADDSFQPGQDNWLLQAAHARRRARTPQELTQQRGEFLKDYAVRDANNYGQGQAKQQVCRSLPLRLAGLDTSRRSPEDALAGFPRFSARLLLRFTLLTPLLSRDDDPFYLFDNPVRKDHILGRPCLSAAALKGLSADAYQRAFPGATPWLGLGEDDPSRTRAFRLADPHARRLFGIADDASHVNASQNGRLHFSPVWFEKIQLLVMNPGDPATAIGTQPIQFEAIAPGQTGIFEVVYFNPYGSRHGTDCDEATVRADLARWLAAVAAWWPVVGLGAKRLGGYGAIRGDEAKLQAVAWSGMAEATMPERTPAPLEQSKPPAYLQDYLKPDGSPLSEEEFAERLAARLKQEDDNVAQLDHKRRHSQGKAQSKAEKAWKQAVQRRGAIAQQQRAEYGKALNYWREHGRTKVPSETQPAATTTALPLWQRVEQGPDSWRRLAEWIAGES